MSGLTEKAPETERHFYALRSLQSGFHRVLVSVPHGRPHPDLARRESQEGVV